MNENEVSMPQFGLLLFLRGQPTNLVTRSEGVNALVRATPISTMKTGFTYSAEFCVNALVRATPISTFS